MNKPIDLYNSDRIKIAARRGIAGANIPCNIIPDFEIALKG